MTGTIILFTGRTERKKRQLFWYSKDECKTIYDRWRNQYSDAVIHICPDAGRCDVQLPPKGKAYIYKKVIHNNRPLMEIEMPDFTPVGFGRHESYYHSCYCRGEK